MTAIIYLHGVGTTKKSKDYSKKFRDSINIPGVDNIEIDWQKIVQPIAQEYFDLSFKKPPFYRLKKRVTYSIRKLLSTHAQDATIYGSVKHLIFAEINKVINQRVIPGEKIIFITHSLGSLIAFDFMNQFKSNNYAGFITMGCNIPLFNLKKDITELPDLPIDSWYNYMEPNDVLSLPILPLRKFMSEGKAWHLELIVRDREFNSKHFFKSWNVAAHNSYWRSKKLIKKIKRDVEILISRS